MNCEKYFERDQRERPDWEDHRRQCSRCSEEWAFEKAFRKALSEREKTPSSLVPRVVSFIEKKRGERLYQRLFLYSLAVYSSLLVLFLLQGPIETPLVPLSLHFSWDLPPVLIGLVEEIANQITGVVSDLSPRLDLSGGGDFSGEVSPLWGMILGLVGVAFLIYGYFLTRKWAGEIRIRGI